MAWGSPTRVNGLYSFARQIERIRKMRSASKGAIVANATHLRLEEGTLDDPVMTTIRFHQTDILRFMADGTIYVKRTEWGNSITTKARIQDITGLYIGLGDISSVNGYATNPARVLFIGNPNAPYVAYNTDAKDAWIKLNPDRSFDMNTVEPIVVECIDNPKELRRVMKRLGRIVRMALGHAKLAGNNDAFKSDGEQLSFEEWLMARYDKTVENVELSPWPRTYYNTEPKLAFEAALKNVRWNIARKEGWTGKHEVLLKE